MQIVIARQKSFLFVSFLINQSLANIIRVYSWKFVAQAFDFFCATDALFKKETHSK
jgi:hypothetical protein